MSLFLKNVPTLLVEGEKTQTPQGYVNKLHVYNILIYWASDIDVLINQLIEHGATVVSTAATQQKTPKHLHLFLPVCVYVYIFMVPFQ